MTSKSGSVESKSKEMKSGSKLLYITVTPVTFKHAALFLHPNQKSQQMLFLVAAKVKTPAVSSLIVLWLQAQQMCTLNQ